jgi:D-serine deaminase-like pyridoxal phosphate-dependent protein
MTSVLDIETPAVLIDLDVVEANIARAQALFDHLGVAFRPHVKTHKLPEMAALQRAAGARGIAAQKISEAEVFAARGFSDILLCTTPLSPDKIARARVLAAQGPFAVVADSAEAVMALAARGAEPLRVLVECDTGGGRCGVQSPGQARDLALRISDSPGLIFGGLMTYPRAGGTAEVQGFMAEAAPLVQAAVGACPVVSSGGTPSLAEASLAPIVTEYRAGTYIYNDRSLLARGVCGIADCALVVLTTVLSHPTAMRAILDAGSKILTSDLMGLTGHGLVLEAPGAEIVGLSEEHGHVDLSRATAGLRVGQKVWVIPNHACPVSNLVDRVVLHRGGAVDRIVPVAARGMVV